MQHCFSDIITSSELMETFPGSFLLFSRTNELDFDFKDSQRSADKLKFPERIRTREHVGFLARTCVGFD